MPRLADLADVGLRRARVVACALVVAGGLAAIARPALAQPARLRPEQRPGSITGVVETAPGEAAVGATVSVVGTVLQTLVLPDGSFRLDEVPPGRYDVFVSGRAYGPVTIEDVVVQPSKPTAVTITLKRYPVLSDVRVNTPARHPQPIYESSATVTVVEPTTAPFAAGHSLERILASSAGVSLSGSMPSLRGTAGTAIDVGARVGLFMDGIPLTSPDIGAPVFAAVPLAAIEQIEIVKGAATTLYGPDVIGGAINVVTPRPADRHRANVNVYTGVYTGTGEGTPQWWGARPQRFSGAELMWTRRSERFGFLAAGTIIRDEGFRQFEPQDRYDLFGRLNVFLPAGAEVRVTGIFANSEHGARAPWRGSDSVLFSSMPDTASGLASTSLRTVGLEYRGVESSSLSFVLRGVVQSVSVDDDLPDATSRQSSGSRYLAEAHLTSFLNRRISFAYGGLAQYDVGSSPQYGDGLTRIVGAYARMEFANLQDIVASVGTRVDLLLMPGSDEERVLEISPSAGVAYTPVPSTSFRASLARGYRPPSIAERKFQTLRHGVEVVPNPALGPEQSWQGEIGAAHRIDLGSASITGDVAFYVHEYFGMIEALYNAGSGLVAFVNLNRARMLGVDADLRVEIARGLLGAAVTIGAVSARDVRTGLDLPGRSPLSATASITWRPEPLTVIATWRHNARIAEIDAATERIIPDARDRVATSLVDLHVGLGLDRYIELPLTAYVNARNLMQAQGFDGVGRVAPIRNVEVGFAVRL